MPEKVVYIVSHGPHCLDGAAAAASIARFYESAKVKAYFPSNKTIGDTIRRLHPAKGEELWITDISWNDEATDEHLRKLIEKGVIVHWIDHHKTAIDRLERGGFQLDFATRIVKDDFSAAKLTYDHLAEIGGNDVPARFRAFAPMADIADDNDRWIHAIEGSRDLGLVLRALPAREGYEAFVAMDDDLSDTPAMAEARTRVTQELKRNRNLANGTRVDQKIGDMTLTSALCDGYSGEIADEWGKKCKRTAFALFDVRSRAMSFRRSPDFDFDLSRLAESCGGGGHPAASGANIEGLPEALGRVVLEAIRQRGKDLLPDD
jgi:oligoribonuclease NrnB/cAMP/cGMP phosphodiesterase (DHH superfamily)